MKTKLTERLLKALEPQAKRYDVYDEVLRGLLLRVETGGTKTLAGAGFEPATFGL